MEDLFFLPAFISDLGPITVYSEIKAGKALEPYLTPLGKYRTDELLIWDTEQKVTQVQTHRFAEKGIDYGDIILIYPAAPSRQNDLVVTKDEFSFHISFKHEISFSESELIGTVTRIIKFFRPPLRKKHSFKSVPTPFLFSKKEIENFDLSACVIGNKDDVVLIKVAGDSMINVGIEEGDIVVIDKTLDYYSRDIVAVNKDGGYIIKRFIHETNDTLMYEGTLISENDKYEDQKIYLDKRFMPSASYIIGVATALIKMRTLF